MRAARDRDTNRNVSPHVRWNGRLMSEAHTPSDVPGSVVKGVAMGQAAAPTAAVALPDPLSQPPSPPNVGAAAAGLARDGMAPSSNKTAADPAQTVPPLDLGLTDDLLSRLAGEEIDRLL